MGRRSRRPWLVRLRPGRGRRVRIQLQQARGRRSIILREPRQIRAEYIQRRRLWRIDAPRPSSRGAMGGGAWVGRIAQRAFHGHVSTLRMCMRRWQRRHAPSQRPSSWIGAVLVHARRCALRVDAVPRRHAPHDRRAGRAFRSGRSGLPPSANVPGVSMGGVYGAERRVLGRSTGMPRRRERGRAAIQRRHASTSRTPTPPKCVTRP